MDRVIIKPEIPDSLRMDDIIHDVGGTDSSVSSPCCSGTHCEDVMELKLEVSLNPVELSMNYEIHEKEMVKDLIETSSGTLSHVIVIAPQEDNSCNYESFPTNVMSYSPVQEEEIKVDTSIPAVEQGNMDIVIKQEETYILKEEINDYQTTEGDIQVSQEHIKLEDDINCSSLDNLNKTVKTEGQPVIIKKELNADGIQEDFVKSERIDGDSCHSYDHMSEIHPGAVITTVSEEGRDVDQHESLSFDAEFDHKEKKIEGFRSKHQPAKSRLLNVEKCKDVENIHVGSQDDFQLGKEVHSSQKHYKYNICGQELSECGKPCSQLGDLKLPRLFNTDKKPSSCEICGKSFTKPTQLHSHMIIHQRVKPFSCADCGKFFPQLRDLKRHQFVHTGERPFSCEICGKLFARRDNLHIHMKIHQEVRPYPCPDCDKAFIEMRFLKRHSLTHTGEKPYPCTLCDRTFRDRYNLKVHQRTHTGEKLYGCTTCDKTFRNKSHLKRHQRTHTGEKPYSCTICDKSFRYQSDLKVHQRTHTGEKPYACTICDKSLRFQPDLKKHQRTHRGEKPYSCTLCDKSFRYQSDL